MNEEKDMCHTAKVKEIIMKELSQFSNTELNGDELDVLYKLVDIYKDLENVDYWNVKKEVMKMRYNDEYSEGGNYGRRGVPGTGRGRYRGEYSDGEEMLEDMKYSYGAYSESMNAYSRGNYSAGQDGMKALEDTMELFTEFTEKMVRQAETPEEKKIIRRYLKRVGQMGDM